MPASEADDRYLVLINHRFHNYMLAPDVSEEATAGLAAMGFQIEAKCSSMALAVAHLEKDLSIAGRGHYDAVLITPNSSWVLSEKVLRASDPAR